MAATLKDVAALAGVHPSTVSRVLRGLESIQISADTRKRILAAAKQLKYQPDQTARALRLRKSDAIGLIVPDISNPFFAGIARVMEFRCHAAGLSLMVCDTNEDQETEVRAVRDLISRGIDGLVIAPVQDSDRHIRELNESGFPFVLIDRCFDDIQTNAVISDNEKAAYDAVSVLAGFGHRHIAFLSGRRGIFTIRRRLSGYQEAVRKLSLSDDQELICGDGFTLESGYESTMKLMSLPRPPTAILASGSKITIGAIKAIVERGLTVPDDISLLAFTDTEYAPYLVCPLTTITHPLKTIGTKAFGLLLDHMENKNAQPLSTVFVDAEFNLRASTGRVPT